MKNRNEHKHLLTNKLPYQRDIIVYDEKGITNDTHSKRSEGVYLRKENNMLKQINEREWTFSY